MKKKNMILWMTCILVVIVTCFSWWIYSIVTKSYTGIIESNWDINLPQKYEEIYEKDSGPSFHGD